MPKKDYNIGGGLTQLPKDDRDFVLGKIEKQIPLSDIPNGDWIVAEPLSIKNQLTSDFCTAFATTLSSEIQEETTLEPSYSFAKTKQIMGDPSGWGADLRSACKAHQKYGALPTDESPMNLNLESVATLRDWNNWHKKFDDIAEEHKKQSYFRADKGNYDRFDNIRVSLWQHRKEKRFVVTGSMWRPIWQKAKIPKGKVTGGYGHAFVIVGQRMIDGEPYLEIQNSYGENVGDKGRYYFPREVVNREFKYGSYMFIDKDPEIIKKNNMASTDIKSKFLELNIRDIGNSVGVVVLSTLFIALTNAMETGGLSVFANLDQLFDIFKVALSAGVAYLFKNLFENEKGENVGLGKIMNGLKK